MACLSGRQQTRSYLVAVIILVCSTSDAKCSYTDADDSGPLTPIFTNFQYADTRVVYRDVLDVPERKTLQEHQQHSLRLQRAAEDAGSGSGGSAEPIETCVYVNETSVEVFSAILTFLRDAVTACEFDSAAEGVSSYTVRSGSIVSQLKADDETVLFVDHFHLNQTYTLEVQSICDSLLCESFIISLDVTVVDYSSRLLPYGPILEDSFLQGEDDGFITLTALQPIPISSSHYSKIYVSTNGLISFSQPLLNWQPLPFPYGKSQIPVVAPYWTDFDFNLNGSAIYHGTYSWLDGMRAQAILNITSKRIESLSSMAAGFQGIWMILVTWASAVPYPASENNDTNCTFQLEVITNFSHTFALVLYEENGINWEGQSPSIGIGYSAGDLLSYLNVNLATSELLTVDSVTGNTGQKGQWLFNLSPAESPLNKYDSECLKWVTKQDSSGSWNADLPSCPCTQEQARSDQRFSFWWGANPNCAVFVWSRPSTTECCYDSTGALIVGPNTGGSYRLFNPIYDQDSYQSQDLIPQQQCCMNSSQGAFCEMYYQYRPSDDCSGYQPVRAAFTWGDPHLESVDGLNFTFNGLGEYVLLQSTANEVIIQARFIKYEDTNATVLSAVAIRDKASPVIQVELGFTGEFRLYLDGAEQSVPANQSFVIVTETGVYNEDNLTNFKPAENNGVLIRNDNGSLVLSTASQAHLAVNKELSFIYIMLQLGPAFLKHTEGLLGYYNNDPSDDFRRPDGTNIPIKSSEEEVYQNFGIKWRIGTAAESILYYHEDFSFATYDDPSFTPAFGISALEDDSALNTQAHEVCDGDYSCLFDIARTGSVTVGILTHEIRIFKEDVKFDLGNFPPTISGPKRVVVLASSLSTTSSYTAIDPVTGNTTAIVLKGSSISGLEFNSTGHLTVSIDSLPNSTVVLEATGSNGATRLKQVSILLCSCANGGTCDQPTDDQTLPLDSSGHYSLPCSCPQGFAGDSCTLDLSGCGNDPCPEYSTCVDNSSAPNGLSCVCKSGYAPNADGKCEDVNECTINDSSICSQGCSNNIGSFQCYCDPGYRLSVDGYTCTDIDECLEDLDNCQQLCNNMNGSYTCSCSWDGFTLEPNGFNCTGVEFDCGAFCDPGVCYENLSSSQNVACSCDPGSYVFNLFFCESCQSNKYGYNCAEECDCQNGGTCSIVSGCMCAPGWTGYNCLTQINNDPPQFPENMSTLLSIPETCPAGVIIARMNASDADFNTAGQVTYSVVNAPYSLPNSTSDGVGVFDVELLTGLLFLSQYLSEQPFSTYLVHIQASDLATEAKSTIFVLTIILNSDPLPYPNFTQPSYTASVDENVPLDTFVATVSCIEINSINEFTTYAFTIVDDKMINQSLKFEGNSILTNQSFDYEEVKLLNFTVACTSSFKLKAYAEVTVAINNLDDKLLLFKNASYEVELLENITNGSTVVTVSAGDADVPGSIVNYILSNSSSFRDLFSIGLTSGVMEVDAGQVTPFNREIQDNYTLVVEAFILYPGGVLDTIEAVVTVQLLDVNDEVPQFYSSSYYITNLTQSNTYNDSIITVSAFDNDLGVNSQLLYSIEVSTQFSINPFTGLVSVKSSMLNRGTYKISVFATDQGIPALTGNATLSILVRPSPQEIRFESTQYTFTVPENFPPGFTVGSVQALVFDLVNVSIDEGSASESLTYVIIYGSDISPFYLDPDKGELIFLYSLDYESESEYTLVVSAKSLAFSLVPATVTVTILLVDINDNGPSFEHVSYSKAIQQDTSVGSTVLTVKATDSDTGTNKEIMYESDKSFVGPFTIGPSSGDIVVSSELGSPKDYHFSVTARDTANFSLSATSTVYISVYRKAAVAPLFYSDQYIFSIPELFDSNETIGTLEAITQGNMSVSEIGGVANFRVKTPSYSSTSLFQVNKISGNVSVILPATFDYENKNTYLFYAELYNISNTNMVFDTVPVLVKLSDENDNSPFFSEQAYSVSVNESTQAGTSILTVSAIDLDSGSNSALQYSLQSNVLGFHVATYTGVVSVTNSTLVPGEYVMTVMATDSSDVPKTSTAQLSIIVVSEPSLLIFSKQFYSFSVIENSPLGTSIGSITVTGVADVATIDSNDIVFEHLFPLYDCLSISSSTGTLFVSCSSLDRENQSTYQIVVTATYLPTNTSGQVMISIIVEDENDNPPIFDQAIYTVLVATSHGNTSHILQVSATDGDDGSYALVEYEIIPNDLSYYLFDIEPTGEIFFTETSIPAGDYSITVQAIDADDNFLNSTSFVHVSVVDTSPKILKFVSDSQNLSIEENSPAESVVGVLQLLAPLPINPADYIGILDFEIIGGEEEFFHIIDSTASLVVINNVLDRESAETHVIHVEASFQGYQVSADTYITINVLDQNDNAPSFNQDIYATTINDSTALGTVLLTVQAVDTDAGSNKAVSYSLEAGAPFVVHSTSGTVSVSSPPDPDHYKLTVTALDAGTPQQTGTAQISIIVIHSLPSSISFSKQIYSVSVLENEPSGTYVTTVSILENSPALKGLVYSLSGTTQFHIDPDNGIVSVLLPLDYETVTTAIVFDVQALHPESGLIASAQVQITVADVNDNKPVFGMSLYTGSITQGLSPTAIILIVHATDADSDVAGMVEYTITSGGTDFLVNLISGAVTTSSSSVTPGTYSLTIIATDKGVPALSSTTLVFIEVYPALPSSIHFTKTLYMFVLVENADPDVVIGSIALQAFDDMYATLQEYFSSSPANFQITPAGNLILASPLDYETQPAITFTVTATVDFNSFGTVSSLSATTMVSVQVQDINDNNPVFGNLPASDVYMQSIPEHSPAGTLIVTTMISDADSDSITDFSYQIDNTFGGRFSILSTGAVVAGVTEIDREVGQSFYTFFILVSDGGSAPRTSSALVQVTVTDINDHKPVLQSGSDIHIKEKQKPGTVVSTIVATDPDDGSNGEVQYELIEESGVETFSIPNADSGELTVLRELDYEPDVPYTIFVLISDKGSPPMTITEAIDIEIIDLPNDARPKFLEVPYETDISPNLMAGDYVFKVTATDDDADLIAYFILPGTQSLLFSIDNAGIIRKAQDEGLDPGSNIFLTIQAQDDSELELTSTATLTIHVYDQFSFTIKDVSITVAEDISVGTSVQTLKLVDASLTELTTFTLTGDATPFELEKADEEVYIRVKSMLDRETRSTPYAFMVVAQTDGYAYASTATVTISVADVNDNKPTFTDSDKRLTAQVTDPPATQLGRVNATDPDLGLNGSIVFSLQDGSVPFSIGSTSGVVVVEAALDAYDSEIAVVVIATDKGSHPMSAQETYTVHVEQVASQSSGLPGIIGLVMVVIFLILVVVVLVIILFARRSRKQPKGKGKDPKPESNWTLKPNKNRKDQSELTRRAGSEDLAYDIMYEDETIMGPQTMPWFDPNYQADAPSRQSELFEESSQTMTPDMESLDQESGLATMPESGNGSSVMESIRKGRRLSADDSSTSDLETTDYLSSYQQTTPMKPGEKPSEVAMLLGHNAGDRPPARPSLKEYIWPHGAPSSKNKVSWPPS